MHTTAAAAAAGTAAVVTTRVAAAPAAVKVEHPLLAAKQLEHDLILQSLNQLLLEIAVLKLPLRQQQ